MTHQPLPIPHLHEVYSTSQNSFHDLEQMVMAPETQLTSKTNK